MVVKTVRLDQVDDVEPVKSAGSRILNSEIVPLCVSPRIVVRFQNQVILVFVYLDCPPEVAALKPCFKDQRVVIRTKQIVVLRYFDFSRRLHSSWQWINRIVNNAVHEALLMCYTFRLSPEAFL
jgi:hypothetical protein